MSSPLQEKTPKLHRGLEACLQPRELLAREQGQQGSSLYIPLLCPHHLMAEIATDWSLEFLQGGWR